MDVPRTPTISVITPTLGRDTLRRAADGLLPQLGPRDEWRIVGDGPRPAARDFVREIREPRIGYDEVAVDHSVYGNAQRNSAMESAAGDLFVFLDDDDELLPGALDAVRRHGVAGRPMMFRMDYRPRRCVLWKRPELRVNNVGGAMFVLPRVQGRWALWRASDEPVVCDFDFITRTLALWPDGALAWHDEIICRCHAHGEGR